MQTISLAIFHPTVFNATLQHFSNGHDFIWRWGYSTFLWPVTLNDLINQITVGNTFKINSKNTIVTINIATLLSVLLILNTFTISEHFSIQLIMCCNLNRLIQPLITVFLLLQTLATLENLLLTGTCKPIHGLHRTFSFSNFCRWRYGSQRIPIILT